MNHLKELEQNCLKQKQLIKDILNYYQRTHYPFFIYQFVFEGEIKHISSRRGDLYNKPIDLKNKDNYYCDSTISKDRKLSIVPPENICDIFSINDFVNDICSLQNSNQFMFPEITSNHLKNINVYKLCLDYKTSRDFFYTIRDITQLNFSSI
jgi:hypothetical protein